MAFTVITLTKVPPSLRGDLTKWMQEIATGVYVGHFNPKVREALWERVEKSVNKGEATMSYYCQSELGYQFKTLNADREIVDWDGIPLVQIPAKESPRTKLKAGFSNQAKYRKARRFQRYSQSEKPSYVILDIETDGLDPKKNTIIEIGGLHLNDKGQEEFTKLIKYEGDLPEEIVKLTNITSHLLQSQGENLKEALEELLNFIQGATIVGYNINFDLRFLNEKLRSYGLPEIENEKIDLMEIVKRDKDHLANYKLSTVLKAYGIFDQLEHQGLSDCKLTYKLGTKVNVFS